MARRYTIFFLPLPLLVSTVFLPGPAAWIAGTLGAAGAAMVMVGLLHPRSRLFGRCLCGVDHPSRIALTFDDGPHPEDTPAILKVLADSGVQATFFFIGSRARANPELVRAAAAAGHDVGAHSQTHPWWFSLAPPDRLRREVGESIATLEAILGRRPRFFRPPMGHKNPALETELRREGVDMVTWSTRVFDTLRRTPDRVRQAASSGIRPGGILLFHEGVSRNSGEPSRTVAALPAILNDLKARGFVPVRLSELRDLPL